MGLFSWCTADTRKSISYGMDGYEGAPEKVYLLNPFGEAYEESHYGGYGEFAGQDAYALVAKWNAPEKCKDENGEWLPDSIIRDIGINMACCDEDHVKLHYPIKIVEKLCSYEQAGISPSCPHQGYFYPEDLEELQEEVDEAFWDLYDTQEAYQDFVKCNGDERKILDRLEAGSFDKVSKAFRTIVAKDPGAPEKVLMELAKNGDVYLKQNLVNNPSLSGAVLSVLEETEGYVHDKAVKHANYGSKIDREKLLDYLKDEMILEFDSPEKGLEFFNTYDSQNFKSVDEMMVFEDDYGFGFSGKWYHICYDEALDVRGITECKISLDDKISGEASKVSKKEKQSVVKNNERNI